jgi:ATP-dependent DNA helicase RecQ
VELIAKYVEENDIVRPDDFVVKSVVNRSANKVYIIQSIDRRLPFEDIARTKDMDLDELITEIESIVASGTRLNIDYYIRQTIDDDKLDDIYDYFHDEAESDSVIDALKELGGDYTEEEVRLVRIKFLSEVGN